jgi:hypothetical protein
VEQRVTNRPPRADEPEALRHSRAGAAAEREHEPGHDASDEQRSSDRPADQEPPATGPAARFLDQCLELVV